jgi:hypothetical protein
MENESAWFLLRPLLDEEKVDPTSEDDEYEIIDGNGKLFVWRDM